MLARDLLAEDGVIFISINDENRALLELLADEALPGMRIGTFVWRTKDSANDAERNFSSVHEHVLIYGRAGFSFLGHELSDKKYRYVDAKRGKYSLDPITKGHSWRERRNTYYPIQDPRTGWWYPCNPDSVWRFASEKIDSVKKKLRSETIEALIKDDRIVFPAKSSVTYKSRQEILKAIRSGTGPVDGNGRRSLGRARRDTPAKAKPASRRAASAPHECEASPHSVRVVHDALVAGGNNRRSSSASSISSGIGQLRPATAARRTYSPTAVLPIPVASPTSRRLIPSACVRRSASRIFLIHIRSADIGHSLVARETDQLIRLSTGARCYPAITCCP